MEDEPLWELLRREEAPAPKEDERFKIIESQLEYYSAELRKRDVTRFLL